MKLTQKNLDGITELYDSRYQKNGRSPETVGWKRGKQNLRFDILLKEFKVEGSKILDIGCGLGDLVDYLSKKVSYYEYFGIDVTKSFIENAKEKYERPFVTFYLGDFLNYNFNEAFDIVVCSGAFNYKLDSQSNIDIVCIAMQKAFKLSKEGIAFNFMSHYVDYKSDIGYYYDPAEILKFAYTLSKNVILWSNYMPFEFTITIFKDDTFNEELVFNKYV